MKFTNVSDHPYRRLAVLSLIAAICYLFFRVHDFTLFYEFMLGRTGDMTHTTLRHLVPFFVFTVDIMFALEQALFLFSNWKKRLPDLNAERAPIGPQGWPRVLVLIPTYNEPLAVVEPPLRAALQIQYPQDRVEVLLLDDGGSTEKRDLVERLKAEYPDRTIGYHSRKAEGLSRRGFKAGNLNFGLANARPGFWGILMLDCDHACRPEILQNLVPYGLDEKGEPDELFGFVQSPQTYEIGTEDWWDRPCREFHMQTQAYRAYRNATMLTGTCALLSAKALRSVGGMDETTVTEDILTGAKIQARGFKSYFHPNPVAFGLVPESLEDVFKQRTRWAQGSFQFLLRAGPSALGLNAAQALTYLGGIFHFFLGFGYLALALLPPIILILGYDASLHYSNGSLLCLGAFVVLRYFSRERYCRKAPVEKIAGAYLSFLFALPYVLSFITAMTFKKITFWTSTKGPVAFGGRRISWPLLAPLVISALNLAGILLVCEKALSGGYPLLEFFFDYSGLIMLALYFSFCGLAVVTVHLPSEKTS